MADSEGEDQYTIRLVFLIPLIILNALMLLITLFLFIFLIKSKAFDNYQCYNILIFSLAVLIDCAVRIIPFADEDHDNTNFWEYLQAFILTFLDKIILSAITTQTILFYLGVIHTKKYFDNDKKVFFISFVINIVICLVLTIIYISNGIRQVHHRLYYYCNSDSVFKKITDTIFNSVYLIPNLYCSIILIMYLLRKIKEVKKGLIEDADYFHHFKRALLMALLNIATFLESYLIIFGELHGEKTDIIYLSTLLLICLFNCGNQAIMKETMRLCCKNKYKRRYGNEEKGNENDDEEDETGRDLVRSRTYSN